MEAEDQNTQNPSLYIGSYQQQLYVQESEAQLRQVVDGRVLNGELVYPKVNWKPYLISADSRTTVINHGNKPKHSELPMLEYQHTKTNDPNKALAVIGGNSEYPYDSGLYLYPDEPDLQTDLIEELKNNVTEGKQITVRKNEKFTRKKKFREIDSMVILVVKTLLSRNFFTAIFTKFP